MNQSGHLTGGGFEVDGSQSLHVQRELEEQFPDQGASPLALVAAPRADASFDDMNDAVAHLERLAAEVPSVTVVPNPQQPPPQPDRPYVVTLQLDFDNTGAVDVAKQLRQKVGIDGEEPGEMENGKVRLYVIGQGALGAAATEATKHDIAQAEKWNLPIVLIVLLAVFGSLAAAAMPLVLGICTVVVTMGLVYLLSMYTTMSVFVTSTVSMFGIALAIDYSLFILMRFREELRAGRDPEQAADAAMATSGLAVRAVRPDRDRLGDRHLSDQHPGAAVDGHRRDPRGGGRGADLDDPDPGGAGDVRPRGGQAVVAICTGVAARRPRSRGSGHAGPAG